MVSRFSWHRQGLNDVQVSAYLINALLDMKTCLILQDQNQDYICITNLPPAFVIPPGVTPDDAAVFGPPIASQLTAARMRLQPGPEPEIFEVQLNKRIFEFRVFCNRAIDTTLQYITVIVDRTAERLDAMAMNTLLLEINHRSKNILAVIQSIANQTERHATDIKVFSRRLRGRIQSISRTQDLVTNSGWKGAYLADIARGELNCSSTARLKAAGFTGSNILLPASEAMHLGLALHELVTLADEAVQAQNTPEFFCDLEQNGELPPVAVFVWRDMVGEKAAAELGARRDMQFIHQMLEKIVPTAMGGSGSISSDGGGTFCYTLRFPFN